ncbi:MAG TPA: hypothetical protein VFR31_17070 [Thermoanaerobaculia bacterium]|nr:hypothetical protein [Thermoanaerobaculia bacterium]
MLIRRDLPLLAVVGLLAGCASSQSGTTDPGDLARELRKRGLEPDGVIIPYQITEEMRAWAIRQVPRAPRRKSAWRCCSTAWSIRTS